jgi:prophage antirepressor-like protein
MRNSNIYNNKHIFNGRDLDVKYFYHQNQLYIAGEYFAKFIGYNASRSTLKEYVNDIYTLDDFNIQSTLPRKTVFITDRGLTQFLYATRRRDIDVFRDWVLYKLLPALIKQTSYHSSGYIYIAHYNKFNDRYRVGFTTYEPDIHLNKLNNELPIGDYKFKYLRYINDDVYEMVRTIHRELRASSSPVEHIKNEFYQTAQYDLFMSFISNIISKYSCCYAK